MSALVQWVVTTLRAHPELAIFLALGAGYWIGGFKVAGVRLGAVTGVLIAGVLIGQLGIEVSDQVKSVFFLLYLFAVGYGVGPQFVQGLARDGGPQALFAGVMSALCLGAAYLAARFQGFDLGSAAGLFAGSQTASASIALSTDAIREAGLSEAARGAALENLSIAYAVTYLWGTFGTGLLLSGLGPKLLGVDLAKECARYEAALGGGSKSDRRSAWRPIELRAYRVREGGAVAGMKVADVERLALARGRAHVERIRRAAAIEEPSPDTLLRSGDVIALSGPRELLVELASRGAEEVEDRELLDVPTETVDLVVTRNEVAGHTLEELASHPLARGVYFRRIRRGFTSVEIPVLPGTRLQRGDVVTVNGREIQIRAMAKEIGYADRASDATDLFWVGVTILLGGLLGAIVVKLGGVPVTLSTAGGTLIAGLMLGWLRGVHPTFGRVPESAQWLMNSLGLGVFIAIVGISCGPQFVHGLKTEGLRLVVTGVLATSIPVVLAPLIGKYVFRFDPAINLGCCAGARNSAASLTLISDAARSRVPMLGYAVPYAVGSTLLTLSGMALVLLLR
jgi:putative transport protein